MIMYKAEISFGKDGKSVIDVKKIASSTTIDIFILGGVVCQLKMGRVMKKADILVSTMA